MRRGLLLAGAALVLTSALAVAQEGPESLLPPGFERPAPRPAARPVPAQQPAAEPGSGISQPVVQPLPAGGDTVAAAAPVPTIKLPPLEVLEKMSPAELEKLLELTPKSDIPPGARRAMTRVGVLDVAEGGLPPRALANQNASLVRAALAGNSGNLVSRWGHILLRRALVSRMQAPAGMDPAEFAGLRASLLVRMGEGEAARALVQDVDTANWSPSLMQAAFDAYVATADFTGMCPALALHAGPKGDPRWDVARTICDSFEGEGADAMVRLDRMTGGKVMPRIDMMLAQKYAGAAGKARRAVTIDWSDVSEMTPWRYGLTLAVGLEPPAELMAEAGRRYDLAASTAPMLGLLSRAKAADRAASTGLLSSAAMVDLWSQVYASQDIEGEWADRAARLRDAYVATDPAARRSAMQELWSGASDEDARYSRLVLTAYAAARLPVNADHADSLADLVASMLAAGLDANALRWAGVAEAGSEAWALLALAAPQRSAPVEASLVEAFRDDDSSPSSRKSAFLLAGLAGLGRLGPDAVSQLAADMEVDLSRQTRWSRAITQAADVGNPALVALLAGAGMQGEDWGRMTPRHLFHIVSALRRVGLDAEARMIAAEAVARG